MALDDLTVRIYWAKRDALEETIVRQEAALILQGEEQYDFQRETRDSIAADLRAHREALFAIGEPPAPRPHAKIDPQKRRERIARRALEGLLAGDPTIDCPTATKRALAHADTLIAALDRHEADWDDN